MKNVLGFLAFVVVLLVTGGASGQTLRVWKGGQQLYSVETSGVDSISFYSTENLPKEETPLTELGKTFETVDLGLPSGLKWATFNLGATKAEEWGDYYQWGGIEPATDRLCAWNTCPLTNGVRKQGTQEFPLFTKYCYNVSYAYEQKTDELTVLLPEDDAASVLLGGKWRMPTVEDWQELFDNCDKKWTEYNGVMGCKFTSKVNGHKDQWIFLPAAGLRKDSQVTTPGQYGEYWSSSLSKLDAKDTYRARKMHFDYSSNFYWGAYEQRYYGFSIRPVTE